MFSVRYCDSHRTQKPAGGRGGARGGARGGRGGSGGRGGRGGNRGGGRGGSFGGNRGGSFSVIVVAHSEGTVEVLMVSTKDSELCVYCFIMCLFKSDQACIVFKQTSTPIHRRNHNFRRISTFLCSISIFH